MKRNLLLNAVFIGALIGTFWWLWPSAKPMPEVTFNLLDGRTLQSQELRGRPLLINFWSVSCEVCLRDMPHLALLEKEFSDRELMVIGVAVPHDPPPAVIGAVEKMAPGYAIALDVHGEVSKAFGDVRVTPTNFLIDPDGNVRLSQRGPLDRIRLRATIATF